MDCESLTDRVARGLYHYDNRYKSHLVLLYAESLHALPGRYGRRDQPTVSAPLQPEAAEHIGMID